MTKIKLSLWLLLTTLGMAACSDNDPIPMLVPLESFETVEVVQNVSGETLTYPKVDILLVIDGSGSMHGHQANMQANIDQFIEHLAQAKLDYQIAVTISGFRREQQSIYPGTIDPNNSGLFHTANPGDPTPYFVTNDTPDVLEVLKQRIRVGTGNDGTETFFAPVVDAIEHSFTSPENVGFFREGAYLVPIFFTDTDDQTKEGVGSEAISFFNRLVSFKGSADLVVPYSVHIPSGYGKNAPCTRDGSALPARIEEFLLLAGGTYYDICAADFGVQLSQLGEDLVNRVATSFDLKEVPDPATIILRYGDIILPNDPVKGWVYFPDTNSIRLGRGIDVPRDESLGLRVEFQRVTKFRQ